MENFDLQLFGGGGGGGSDVEQIKKSAPGSNAAPTIDQATAGARQKTQANLRKVFGREGTQTNAGGISISADSIKKALLGE